MYIRIHTLLGMIVISDFEDLFKKKNVETGYDILMNDRGFYQGVK